MKKNQDLDLKEAVSDSVKAQGPKDVSLLSDAEIRVMIARLLGWTSVVEYAGQTVLGTRPDEERHTVPDYCNDLNAMHEAEKVIYSGPHIGVVHYEMLICNRVEYPLNATARQRAEAFVMAASDPKGADSVPNDMSSDTASSKSKG